VVDLRELAVTRGLCGRDRHTGIPLDSQLEDRAIIGIRASKRSNDNMGIDGFGEGEELDRQLLLGLDEILH
jgi:hypothetical protein